MSKIQIRTKANNNLEFDLPQGMTGSQFFNWKEKNKDLIAKARENVGGMMTVDYKDENESFCN